MDKNVNQVNVLHIGLSEGKGGIENKLLNICNWIDREKVNLLFIAYHENCSTKTDFEKLGFKVWTLPSARHPIKYLNYWKNIIHKEKIDIFHFHKNSLTNIIPLIICKLYGAREIFVHSCNTSSSFGKIFKPLHYIHRPFVNMIVTNRLACSQSAAEWMFGKSASSSRKVKILLNGWDTKKFSFKPDIRDKLRSELGIETNCPVIGHVGRFTSQKNHEFIIDIFARCIIQEPKVKLLLIGDGILRTKIKSKVESLGLLNSVIFIGDVKNTEIYYQAMDVFLMPSLYEGFANVRVEAQCSGLSVIMSDIKANYNEDLMAHTYTLDLQESADKWSYIVIKEARTLCQNTSHRISRLERIRELVDIEKKVIELTDIYLGRKKGICN